MDGSGSSTHLDAPEMKYFVSESLKLLHIHKETYLDVPYEGILWDHCTSLAHGLEFLKKFFEFSRSKDLKQRIRYLVFNVKQKLHSLTHLSKDESLVMKLDSEYSDLREQMKNVIIKPGTNEYDAIFPDIWGNYSKLSVEKESMNMLPYFQFLYQKMVELVRSYDNADHVSSAIQEHQTDIWKMLKFLRRKEFIDIISLIENAKEQNKFTTVLDRVACFIYLSLIGKMDCEMVLSFKNDYIEIENLVSESLELLKIHKEAYQGVSNEHVLWHHCVSLTHGLQFLRPFSQFSQNNDLKQHIRHLAFNVTQKLYSLSNLMWDSRYAEVDIYGAQSYELERAYAEIREDMKNVIINPRTNEYDVIFFRRIRLKKVHSFLSREMENLLKMEELEDLRKMLTCWECLFWYADNASLFTVTANSLTAVLDGAARRIYLSFIGKMDSEMVLCSKNETSVKIEATLIMRTGSYFRNLKIDISKLLSLMNRNKECYLGAETGDALEDHFISIEHGLQFLHRILELSGDNDLKLRVQHLFSTVEAKLKSLTHLHYQEHAYEEIRNLMQNVVTKPSNGFGRINTDFLLEEIRKLVTSSCKADKIAPIMNELGELSNNLISSRLLIAYALSVSNPLAVKKEEEEIFVALTTFLDGASSVIYLSIVGKLNEDMLVSLRKHFSLLIEGYQKMESSFVLGRGLEGDLDSNIDNSLSLLRGQEEDHIVTTDEVKLKDHIMSLKHGYEFLKWFLKIYNGRYLESLKLYKGGYLERRIILLAGCVKHTLISLTYKQREETMNMDVNDAYADLREEMTKMFINQETGKYDILFPDSNMIPYVSGETDFLIEEIETLVTSNCKADQIAPLKEDLQHLQKVLTYLKPLDLYNGGVYDRVSTIHYKAMIFIYLSFVGKMDSEMVLWVKSNITTTIEEMDVREMYSKILNQDRNIHDLEEDLCLLDNLMLLLEGNAKFLNDDSSKLHGALKDVHNFLSGLSKNVILRNFHLLQASFQAILRHSIPIVCSCYLEHTEIDISVELNCVRKLIEQLKSEAQKIKLDYFPRVDDLGFLELFLGYLDDLLENQEISMKEEVDVLHVEIQSLLNLAKVTNQEELNKTPWTDIINMAYQAEYIIDLRTSSSSRDLGLTTLSNIITQLKKIRANMHGVPCESLKAQDIVESIPQIPDTITQVSDDDAIVSFQKEATIIEEHLLNGEKRLDVISIVGMAGVGKTTLASTLFKRTPSRHFDKRACCTVSQNYTKKNLLLAILDQVNSPDKSHRSISDDEKIACHLRNSLKKRRYLIVLDDIWDTELWKDLKCYLPDDGNSSRVLITTRNWDVADQIGSRVNKLDGLSDEKSWELFQKKMLATGSLSDDLHTISKRIVESCKRLPLSIVIIVGILSNIERTREKWNEIAESVSSLVLLDPQGTCKEILELSYNHLPNHLRSCFLYMGSFPEDKEVSVKHLTNMWIAERFVRDTNSESAEEVGRKYMEDLIVKSLVIPAKKGSGGRVKTFQLHDLLRDFCLEKAKEKHFFTVLHQAEGSLALQDPRRLIIYGSLNDGPLVKGLRFSCHSIRLMIRYDRVDASEIEKQIEECDMVLLQVLEVGVVNSDSFPDISRLVHLRYLELGFQFWTNPVLPSSIDSLQNLQTLILRCKDRVTLPDLIWDMVKLRYVDISPSTLFQVDPNRLQNSSFLLENLRYLSNSRVSWDDSEWLCKLSGLERLSFVFYADCLEEDDDIYMDDITETEDLEEDDVLVQDDNLKEEDEVGKDDIAEVDEDVEHNNFQMLSFNSPLTSLKVRNAADIEQSYMRRFQLPNSLHELTLSKFFLTSDDISNIGRALPKLEVFKIYSCYVPSGEWKVDDENFPKLKVLKLRDLKITEWDASEDSFPKLEQLWVEYCNHLDKIPLEFGSLPKLSLITVRKCKPSVDDSAREIEKQQHDQNNTEMRVRIHH